MKKAQLEMFGLVIIVILIALILVFFIRFSLMGKGSEMPSAKLAIQASNLLNAILKANLGDKTIMDVVSDCCNDVADSCNTANIEIKKIIDYSLEDLEYSIKVEGCTININSDDFDKCTETKAANYPIRVGSGFNEFSLRLCKL